MTPMDAACLVRAKQPVRWQTQAPWHGVLVRSCATGLRLLQALDADDASPRKAALLVIGAPDGDVAALLESLENRDAWIPGLKLASTIEESTTLPLELASPFYDPAMRVAVSQTTKARASKTHFLLEFGDARSLAAAARVLNDDLCRVIVVDDRLDDADEDDHGRRELPTCASCFDRLDLDDDRDDEPRKPQRGCATCNIMTQPQLARCSSCNDARSVWACLVCGDLGCGRYAREHAKDHAAASGHGFALEVATGRVWDYHGDRFAHRVRGSRRSGDGHEQKLPQLKLRSLADRYEKVLLERLAEQRRFYEGKLRDLPPPPLRDDSTREAERARDRAVAQAAAWAAKVAAAEGTLREKRATHERLRRAAALAKAKAAASRAAAADTREASRVAMVEARAQLADIEFACRARRELASTEAAGGAVVGVAAPPPPKRKSGKKGRGRAT